MMTAVASQVAGARQSIQAIAQLVSAYLSVCNRSDEAIGLIERARGFGHRAPDTTKLLIDLLFRRGRPEEALELARVDSALLAPDERRAVGVALGGRR
jgi:hypothetical protein